MARNAMEAAADGHEERRVRPKALRALLEVRGLRRSFKQGGAVLTVLDGLDLSIEKGEMVALVGHSGTGKSTLLQLIGLLDTPSAGTIAIDGHDAAHLNESERTRMRRDFIGFIYQFHNLQAEFSALENVMLPQMIAGRGRKEARDRAVQLLGALGLSHRVDHRPGTLSGGEQQRVAIARALANRPRLLLADEPTGNLDPSISAEVFKILVGLARNSGIGMLVATHNMDLADQMDRVLELRGGRVEAR